MTSLTPLDLALRMLALSGSAALTGAIAFISHGMVPTLLLAPPATAHAQFRSIFNIGKATAGVIGGLTSLSYVTLAYRASGYPGGNRASAPHHPLLLLLSNTAMYAVAAVATVAILPYTLTVMATTNGELLGSVVPKGERVTVLLERWARMNYGRACLTLVGTVFGLAATLR